MKIPEVIIENIQVEPLKTAIAACEYVDQLIGERCDFGPFEHEILMEAYALVSEMAEARLIEFSTVLDDVEVHHVSSCMAIANFLWGVSYELEQQQAAQTLASMKRQFANIISSSFTYEFTESDVARIQTLLGELWQLLCDNDELEEQHKRRLLKRIESLQSEIRMKMSDLDHFYGLTVEGSVMRKKVGGNLKPIVDRIMEITKITWATQSRAEDLPYGSDPSLIGHDAVSQR
ncbi:hypothetical protein [Pseudomonas sp. VI4.1]|uniref:hypothetical protein n=1 Tax=Pseudomonas sp. VI4.1 TaxID=1941346 RepID=UPI0009CED52A|nr:hypothetical protein [Pseudomonas sp. VI4.1]OPK11867.1 hypothetical protein BZ163_01695 [Pseudomonas sp. VI4.1]